MRTQISLMLNKLNLYHVLNLMIPHERRVPAALEAFVLTVS